MGMVPTQTVGQTVSSPYYNPGTVVNSSTGQVVGSPAAGPTLPAPGTNPNTSQAPSNNGGGGGFQYPSNPNVNQVADNGARWDGHQWIPKSGTSGGPSQDDINNAINDTYNASNNYLNQAETQVNADYPTVKQDIQGQYDTGLGQLNTTNQGVQQQYTTQGQNLNQSNESALAASRRLYSELNQGYNQRFGGSTSAGDASHELANVAQQRAQGQQNVSFQQAQQQINNNKAQTDAQYQQNILALDTQKNTALNQAQRDFSNKLLTISQSRAQNEQAKGQAKLQALQDLRNQIFSINQQNTQFQQTLEAQRQQTANQYALYSDLANKGVDTSSQALSDFQNKLANAQSGGFRVGGTTGQQTPTYAGSTGPVKYDQFGNPIL